MYRTAPPGFPPPPDPLLVTPGEGLRGILVGRATAADVLRELGDDGRVSRHGGGEVCQIDYGFDQHGVHRPDRPAQASRPHSFVFEGGVLDTISVNGYQHQLYTTGGIRYGSTRAEVVAVFGDDGELVDQGAFHSLRYPGLGIELVLLPGEASVVIAYGVFRAAR